MKELKLTKKNTGVFLKSTDDVVQKILMCEDHITYGYPNRKCIEQLIFKRGFLDVDGKRSALVNNLLIEKKLGSLGIVCVEDLIHEIECLGENFERVNELLWPFVVKQKDDVYSSKPFNKGGDTGCREEKINQLVLSLI